MKLDGLDVRVLGREDAALLQDLLVRSSDFNELAEGVPTRATAAEEELTSIAPGTSEADQVRLGIFEAGRLIGFLQFTRGFPKPREWWIGFLIFEPAARRRGLGARLHDALVADARAEGVEAIRLVVLEQNAAGERFWRRCGYVETERQLWTAPTGLRSTAILMRLPLAGGER